MTDAELLAAMEADEDVHVWRKDVDNDGNETDDPRWHCETSAGNAWGFLSMREAIEAALKIKGKV